MIRVFTSYDTSESEFAENFPGSSLSQSDYELQLNRSGPADLALILGYARPGKWVEGCELGVYKLIQDPPQPGLFGRFTRFAPRWADVTLTPFPAETFPRKTIDKHPAIFNWHLGVSFDDVVALNFDNKPKGISCIASTKRDLPGHNERFDFVQHIEQSDLNIDVFGRGRATPLPRGKLAGLLPYRYSVAIENTVHEDYFTEKVLDCWLSGTVPIYFGAPNLDKYFPTDSFIRLPDLNPSSFEARVRSGEFSEAGYEGRRAAIEEAREIVLKKFSMHALVQSTISRGLRDEKLVRKGRVRLTDLDSFSHSIRDFGARLVNHG